MQSARAGGPIPHRALQCAHEESPAKIPAIAYAMTHDAYPFARSARDPGHTAAAQTPARKRPQHRGSRDVPDYLRSWSGVTVTRYEESSRVSIKRHRRRKVQRRTWCCIRATIHIWEYFFRRFAHTGAETSKSNGRSDQCNEVASRHVAGSAERGGGEFGRCRICVLVFRTHDQSAVTGGTVCKSLDLEVSGERLHLVEIRLGRSPSHRRNSSERSEIGAGVDVAADTPSHGERRGLMDL